MLRIDNLYGNIQICCLGLLQSIASGRYKLLGIGLEYPALKDAITGYEMKYCQACGRPLNPNLNERKEP